MYAIIGLGAIEGIGATTYPLESVGRNTGSSAKPMCVAGSGRFSQSRNTGSGAEFRIEVGKFNK